ncbi:Bromo adjacent homology (BAH) domain-containing protein [Artemisia annua]|uniref:Bromo adjacent homology (BAH) domain-containing protein n=1 Tax=Artemisia annua TaxID=35608 RepID=A0A2U1PBI4_ARTAN|nr:Bromo adjacent homology (BAH) domain-containing protein [Artemisia annua]
MSKVTCVRKEQLYRLFINQCISILFIYLLAEFTGSALKGVTDWTTLVLTDHRPYKLSEDDFHRVCRVPHKKGANFRDFPGVIVDSNNTVHRDRTKEVLLPSGKPLLPDYVFTFEKGKSRRMFEENRV